MRILLIGFIFTLCSSFQALEKIEIFISPLGNDNNSGTLQKPFATPERARDAIRIIRDDKPDATFCVYFRGGTYYRYESFELNELDAGRKNAPVVYRPYKDENVTFHGGKRIDGHKFYQCTDGAILSRLAPEVRNNIWVLDLKTHEISDFGELRQHGFGTEVGNAPMELFINGKPQILGRYPNEGVLGIGYVYDKGSTPCNGDLTNRGAEFGYDYDRPARWLQADDIWLHGKFSYGYNDDNLKISFIDTAKRSFKILQPHIYGVFTCNVTDPATYDPGLSVRGYYAYNLLEEIDMPGEYFIDRKTGKLYIFPATSLAEADIEVSVSQTPFMSFKNTSDITLEGFKFTCTRALGISLEHSRNITIDACKFTNFGTVAVKMEPSLPDNNTITIDPDFEGNVISNCYFSNMGTGGVFIEGGDRRTLTPGNNQVFNCEFDHVDRINDTYSPAVWMNGVGNILRNCYIHDMKHLAVNFMGNDHLIEYNKMENICQDADDMGAIYSGRDPSARGTIIQYNLFSHIVPKNTETSLSGIFIDDGSGGITINNNFFYKVGNPGHYKHVGAVFIHGGHDNTVINNIFLDCDIAVGHGPWDDARWKAFLESDAMLERLRRVVDITGVVYQEKYPELKGYYTHVGRRLNIVRNNAVINGQLTLSGDLMLRENVAVYNSNILFNNYQEVNNIFPTIGTFPFEKAGCKTQ